ncbi:MAG: hypothetical protein ABGY41_23435 [Candidatus Poribacteria bacterium]
MNAGGVHAFLAPSRWPFARVRPHWPIALLVCLAEIAAPSGVARAEGGSTVSHDIESAAVAGNQMGITSLRRVLV